MTTLPPRSAATQRLLLGQDTPARAVEPSTLVTVHATAPPVGLLEVTTLPFTSWRPEVNSKMGGPGWPRSTDQPIMSRRLRVASAIRIRTSGKLLRSVASRAPRARYKGVES